MPKLRKLNLRIPAVTKLLVSYQHTVSIKKMEKVAHTQCHVSLKNQLLLPVVPTIHKPLPHHHATLTFNLVHSHNILSTEITLLNSHVSFLSTCLIPWTVIQPHLLFMQEQITASQTTAIDFCLLCHSKNKSLQWSVYSQTSTCKTFIWSQLDITDILGCNCISRTTAVC